ncbi:MAG: hypothetical protein ACH346_07030 [Chthoniobacterales bacterium]
MESLPSTNQNDVLARYETFANDSKNLGKEVVGFDAHGENILGETKDFFGSTMLFLTGGRKKIVEDFVAVLKEKYPEARFDGKRALRYGLTNDMIKEALREAKIEALVNQAITGENKTLAAIKDMPDDEMKKSLLLPVRSINRTSTLATIDTSEENVEALEIANTKVTTLQDAIDAVGITTDDAIVEAHNSNLKTSEELGIFKAVKKAKDFASVVEEHLAGLEEKPNEEREEATVNKNFYSDRTNAVIVASHDEGESDNENPSYLQITSLQERHHNAPVVTKNEKETDLTSWITLDKQPEEESLEVTQEINLKTVMGVNKLA